MMGPSTAQLANQPRDKTTTEMIAHRINSIALEFTNAFDNLDRSGDRIFGSKPEVESAKASQLQAIITGSLSEIEAAICHLESVMSRAHGCVARFSEL